MAQVIKIKRSAIAAKSPAVADLALGELAMNTTDGKLFMKKNVGGVESIVELGANSVTGVQGNLTYDASTKLITGYQSDWHSRSGPSAVLNKPDLYYYSFLSSYSSLDAWYLIAVLPVPSLGTYEQLRLFGCLNDGWAAVNNSAVDIIFGNRGTAEDAPNSTKWSLMGNLTGLSRIQAYRQSDSSVQIYVKMQKLAYAVTSFSLQGTGNGLNIISPSLVTVTNTQPSGVLTFDTSDPNLTKPFYYKPVSNTGPVEFPTGLSSGYTAGSSANNHMTAGDVPAGGQALLNQPYIQYKVKVNGIPGVSYPGAFSWATLSENTSKKYHKMTLRNIDDSDPNTWSSDLMTIRGDGDTSIAGSLAAGWYVRTGGAGPSNWGWSTACNSFYTSEADIEVAQFGRRQAANPSLIVNHDSTGGGWNSANSILFVTKAADTNRSISAAGTINTSGNDYAEYMTKSANCQTIIPGQIVGVDANGQLTDVYSNAIKFVIKSTKPSFVGGDTWHTHIIRPNEPKRIEPEYKIVIDVVGQPAIPPNGEHDRGTPEIIEQSHSELVRPGTSDAEWSDLQNAYADAKRQFDDALEAARRNVDRIAFCGQVPVNVYGATPGQHIVPTSDGDKIIGVLVNDLDITFTQFRQSVGQVIAIEPDGRARVIVKL